MWAHLPSNSHAVHLFLWVKLYLFAKTRPKSAKYVCFHATKFCMNLWVSVMLWERQERPKSFSLMWIPFSLIRPTQLISFRCLCRDKEIRNTDKKIQDLLPLTFFPKSKISSGRRCNMNSRDFEDLYICSVGAQWYSQTFEWSILLSKILIDSPHIAPDSH